MYFYRIKIYFLRIWVGITVNDRSFKIKSKVIKEIKILNDLVKEAVDDQKESKNKGKSEQLVIDISHKMLCPEEFGQFLHIAQLCAENRFCQIALRNIPSMMNLANRFNNKQVLNCLSKKLIYKLTDNDIKDFLDKKGPIPQLLMNVDKDIQQHYLKKFFLEKYNEIETDCIIKNAKTLTGHKDWIYSVTELINGCFVSCSFKTIQVWSQDGNRLQTLTDDHPGYIKDVIALKNGNIVSRGDDNIRIKIWSSDYRYLKTLIGHKGIVNTLIELENGNIISCSDDKTIKIWSPDGTCLKTLIDHKNGVNKVIELKNSTIASCSDDRTIKIWSTNGNCLTTLIGHNSWVKNIIELKNGTIVSCSGGRSIKIWSLDGSCLKTLTAHDFGAINIIGLKNGNFVSYAGNQIKIWSLDGTCLKTLTAHESEIKKIIELKNGTIVSCSADNTIKVWSSDGFCLKTLTSHSKCVHSIIELRNGNIVSCSCDNTIKIWPINILTNLSFEQLLIKIAKLSTIKSNKICIVS